MGFGVQDSGALGLCVVQIFLRDGPAGTHFFKTLEEILENRGEMYRLAAQSGISEHVIMTLKHTKQQD